MACNYEHPPKGHEKKGKLCGLPETANGRCAKHQPPRPTVAVTPVTYNWAPHTSGDLAVDTTFQAACDEVSDQIDKYCENGPVAGGSTFNGKVGGKVGSFQLHHETQPRTNQTFFFNWQGSTMHVYAAGKHTGQTNKVYTLTWFDGSSAEIDLRKGSIT